MKYQNSDVDFSIKTGQKKALRVFHQAATRIPAYKQFLRQNHIKPGKIKAFEDFSQIPPTTKENYLNKFDLSELMWDGKIEQAMIISASSGTTGLPYYWPLSQEHIDEGAIIKNMVYRRSFAIHKHPTLMIVCFGMGTWIAGMYTTLTTLATHNNGLPVTLITPGFNKEETIRILRTLAPHFEQVVIAGIPTFIKDLLEQWSTDPAKKTAPTIKLLFAGEGFSEEWRTYVLDLIGSKDPEHDAVSILGSADASIMGFETPESIALRRSAAGDMTLRNKLFQSERLPALAAFVPAQRFFQNSGDELLLTADRCIPLIRYNIHDIGGILPATNPHEPPLVYVFGRGKFTATIYAANIYPENIRDVLTYPKLARNVTGKFIIETRYDNSQDHYLHMDIELAQSVEPNDILEKMLIDSFVTIVRQKNSEYHRVHEEYGHKAHPRVTLHPYGTSPLFPIKTIKKLS